MGYYCKGTATVEGSKEIIVKLSGALDLLDGGRLATITGYAADEDWLPHIFKGGEKTQQGIFSEGYDTISDTSLDLYIRASRCTGVDFFKKMSEKLGVVINWEYLSELDSKVHTHKFVPTTEISEWELYSHKDMLMAEDTDTSKVEHAQTSTMKFMSFVHAGTVQINPQEIRPSHPNSIVRNDAVSADALDHLLVHLNMIGALHGLNYEKKATDFTKYLVVLHTFGVLESMRTILSSLDNNETTRNLQRMVEDRIPVFRNRIGTDYANSTLICPKDFFFDCQQINDALYDVDALLSELSIGGKLPDKRKYLDAISRASFPFVW